MKCCHQYPFIQEFPIFKLLLKEPQVYLRRNREGDIDPDGKIWAAPYRWGCMVIAYKKSKFQKHNLAPIQVTCLKNHSLMLNSSITTNMNLFFASLMGIYY